MRRALTATDVAAKARRIHVVGVSTEQDPAARILVVEDDPEARATFDLLLGTRWTVTLAERGDLGRDQALASIFDLVIANVQMPGLSGIELARQLRAERTTQNVPLILMSHTAGQRETIAGLEAGADDYLVKPFAFAELLARIEALARRSDTVVKETVLRVGDLELDLVSRTVRRSGRRIELLPREFQVLEYLVRNQGRVVPRAMLLQHVWDLCFDPTTNIIDVYVGRVRKKVDGLQAYPLIHTVRGVGFSVSAPG